MNNKTLTSGRPAPLARKGREPLPKPRRVARPLERGPKPQRERGIWASAPGTEAWRAFWG
jgi:hypothetical protein